jgi:hypothetical protein
VPLTGFPPDQMTHYSHGGINVGMLDPWSKSQQLISSTPYSNHGDGEQPSATLSESVVPHSILSQKIDPEIIRLAGRWRSLAYEVYIRAFEQIASRHFGNALAQSQV